MREMRYVAATGAVGAGVDRDSLFAALDEGPRFIAADAGTTDAGAFSLGSGETAFSRDAVKRDLSLMLQAFGTRIFPLVAGAAALAFEIVARHLGVFAQIVACAELTLVVGGFALVVLGRAVRHAS